MSIMEDINVKDLETVTGGGFLDNMEAGGTRLGNRWSKDAANAGGGRGTVFGDLGSIFGRVGGWVVGGVQGLGHSATDRIPLPQK